MAPLSRVAPKSGGSGLRNQAGLSAVVLGLLAQDMLACGLRATNTCVDPRQPSALLVGRGFDQALLDDLPAAMGPSGERGECFAHAGPTFAAPAAVVPGDVVARDGFTFSDLLPA